MALRRINDHANHVTSLPTSSSATLLSLLQFRKHTFAALITCLPLPFPSAAPSIIPGKSSTWISAPPYSRTPGMAVSVVNAYAATSDFVFVILERNVDFPTEGNPTSAIRASPDFDTSKPDPPPPEEPGPGSRSCARRRASLLYV